jgi:hypothetical protein
MKKAVFNANYGTIDLSTVNVGTSSIIDDIMYNEEVDDKPGPNHIIKLADICSILTRDVTLPTEFHLTLLCFQGK